MKSFKVFSIRLYIDTLIKGHKDKIWFSLKQKSQAGEDLGHRKEGKKW